MDNDTDLTGMDPESAREYVSQYIITLKRTHQDLQTTQNDLALWTNRASLAAEKGREDLKAEALKRCLELSEKEKRLEAEELALAEDVKRMRQQLVMLQRSPKMSVNADLLLAQLEQVVGEEKLTEGRFRETEADQALEELKRRMGSGNEPAEEDGQASEE